MAALNLPLPRVNPRLVKQDLNFEKPVYLSWDRIVDILSVITLPQDHKNLNACSTKLNCTYPPGPLDVGVPRVLMPEVNRDVLENLKGKISYEEHKMSVKDLASSYVAQREILLPKIQGQAESHETGAFNLLDNTWYVATATDGKKVIIDGHHGWGALNLLLNKRSPRLDPNAMVNVVDFKATPEKVIEMAFYEGDAHSNPFRPNLVKKGGYKRRTQRRRTRRHGRGRRSSSARSRSVRRQH